MTLFGEYDGGSPGVVPAGGAGDPARPDAIGDRAGGPGLLEVLQIVLGVPAVAQDRGRGKGLSERLLGRLVLGGEHQGAGGGLGGGGVDDPSYAGGGRWLRRRRWSWVFSLQSGWVQANWSERMELPIVMRSMGVVMSVPVSSLAPIASSRGTKWSAVGCAIRAPGPLRW